MPSTAYKRGSDREAFRRGVGCRGRSLERERSPLLGIRVHFEELGIRESDRPTTNCMAFTYVLRIFHRPSPHHRICHIGGEDECGGPGCIRLCELASLDAVLRDPAEPNGVTEILLS